MTDKECWEYLTKLKESAYKVKLQACKYDKISLEENPQIFSENNPYVSLYHIATELYINKKIKLAMSTLLTPQQ